MKLYSMELVQCTSCEIGLVDDARYKNKKKRLNTEISDKYSVSI